MSHVAYITPLQSCKPLVHQCTFLGHICRPPSSKPLPKRLPRRIRPPKIHRASPVSSYEPVENGVTLPSPKTSDETYMQSTWLQTQITAWLEREWRQDTPQQIHMELGERVGLIYQRQRLEGENDLASILLAIGSELEGFDFSRAFVGPWNVANKAAELIMEACAGERGTLPEIVRKEGAKAWVKGTIEGRGKHEMHAMKDTIIRRPASPSLADAFERLKFLQDVLDESVGKERIDGAVAIAKGFTYDATTGKWDASAVTDEHFKQFGNDPPDVLGDESDCEITDTLNFLQGELETREMEDGNVKDGLDVVIETLHGVELTKIRSLDKDDHSFRKRAIVVKWLHLLGGF